MRSLWTSNGTTRCCWTDQRGRLERDNFVKPGLNGTVGSSVVAGFDRRLEQLNKLATRIVLLLDAWTKRVLQCHIRRATPSCTNVNNGSFSIETRSRTCCKDPSWTNGSSFSKRRKRRMNIFSSRCNTRYPVGQKVGYPKRRTCPGPSVTILNGTRKRPVTKE